MTEQQQKTTLPVPPPNHTYFVTVNIGGGFREKQPEIGALIKHFHEPLIVAVTETKLDGEAMRQNPNALKHPFGGTYNMVYTHTPVAKRQEQKRRLLVDNIHGRHNLSDDEKRREIARIPALLEPANESAGVALAVHSQANVIDSGSWWEGRHVFATIKQGATKLHIHAVYAPTSGHPEQHNFWEELGKRLHDTIDSQDDDSEQHVLLGDMNSTLNEQDRGFHLLSDKTSRSQHTPPVPHFLDAVNGTMLDAYTQVNAKLPYEASQAHKRATYIGHTTWSRIDMILGTHKLITESLADFVVTDYKRVELHTNHKTIAALFNLGCGETVKIQFRTIDVVDRDGYKNEKTSERYRERLDDLIRDNDLHRRATQLVSHTLDERTVEHMQTQLDTVMAELNDIIGAAVKSSVGTKKKVVAGRDNMTRKLPSEEVRLVKMIERFRKGIASLTALVNEVEHQHNPEKHVPERLIKLWNVERDELHKIESPQQCLVEGADESLTWNTPALKATLEELRKLNTTKTTELHKTQRARRDAKLREQINNLQTMHEDPAQLGKFYHVTNPDKAYSQTKQISMVIERNAQGDEINRITQPEQVKSHVQSAFTKIFQSNPSVPAHKAWFEAKHQPRTEERDPLPAWLHTDILAAKKQRISAHSGSILSEEFTVEEFAQALEELPKKKACGIDGRTAECYQNLTKNGREILRMIMNIARKWSIIPSQWKESKVYLIHKAGDQYSVDNYRPIALCQIAYKLFTTLVNDRLNKMLVRQDIISAMQNGFRSRRCCEQKIRQLAALVGISNKTKKPLHVLYIDLKKAYDSVEHSTLLLTLRAMGFDERFVTLIENMYRNNTISVITPHGDTGSVPTGRGVKQGCPMSPLLFDLVLEPLLWALEEAQRKGLIKGYAYDAEQATVALAYADDIALTSESNADLQTILNMYQRFCEWNGLEVALDRHDAKVKQKTVYTHNDGNAPHHLTIHYKTGEHKPVPTIKSSECYRYLGVYINLDLTWDQQREISEQKIRRFLAYTSQRRFTAQQIVMVLNHVVLPGITYRMPTVDYGEKWCKAMDRAFATLVNRKRRMLGMLAATYLHQPLDQGGIALKSVAAAQVYHQAFGVYKALNSPDAHCAAVSRRALKLGCLPGNEVIENENRMHMKIRLVENMEAEERKNDPGNKELRNDWSRWFPSQQRAAYHTLFEHCRSVYEMATPDKLLHRERGSVTSAIRRDLRHGREYEIFVGKKRSPGHPLMPADDNERARNWLGSLDEWKDWWALQNHLAWYPHAAEIIANAKATNRAPAPVQLHPMIALEHNLTQATAYVPDKAELEIWTDASINKASKRMASAYWTATENEIAQFTKDASEDLTKQLLMRCKLAQPPNQGYIITNDADDINSGEMKAAILALAQFKRTRNITLYTDSAYVVAAYERMKQLYMPRGKWDPPVNPQNMTDTRGARSKELRMLQELVAERWQHQKNIEILKVHAHLIDEDADTGSFHHKRRYAEMKEKYDDRVEHVLMGNRLVDIIAKDAATRAPPRTKEPQREQSRFGDAYSLFVQVNPALRKKSPYAELTDYHKIYHRRVEHDWQTHWKAKQSKCVKENKPPPIIWADDETVDRKYMGLLWKRKKHEEVELHNFRDRMLRKELPEKRKLNTRITDERQGKFWSDVYNKRGLLERYSSPLCPMGCGQPEHNNHFVHECPDPKLQHTAEQENALATTIFNMIVDNAPEEEQDRVRRGLVALRADKNTQWMNGLKHKQWIRYGVLPKQLRKTLTKLHVDWISGLEHVLRKVQVALIAHTQAKWRVRCAGMIEGENEQKKRQQEHELEMAAGDEEDRRQRVDEERRMQAEAERRRRDERRRQREDEQRQHEQHDERHTAHDCGEDAPPDK